MSDRQDWTKTLSNEELTRCLRLAETVIRDRRQSIERLDAFRLRAQANGLAEIEEFLFQVQQSDQRVLNNAEKLFGQPVSGESSEDAHRERLVDEQTAESFPASDPPTHSRIT